jgi:hypothetical protein
MVFENEIHGVDLQVSDTPRLFALYDRAHKFLQYRRVDL